MWLADQWKDYELLDTSSGNRLERWGDYVLVRRRSGSRIEQEKNGESPTQSIVDPIAAVGIGISIPCPIYGKSIIKI